MDITILLFDELTALDAVGPYDVLRNIPDAQVTFVAPTAGICRTEDGSLGLEASRSLDEVRATDVLVVPGGYGTRRLIAEPAVTDWVRDIHQTTSWTTSVCTGSLLLGAAGLLDGLRATTHWLEYDLLASFGAEPTAERVVQQGKIITSAGVSSGIDMALTLAAEACGAEVAQAIQLVIEYDPQPPFDAGSPATAPRAVVDLVRQLADSRREQRAARARS